MKHILIVKEIADQFFEEYAHREQDQEQQCFFEYPFPGSFSLDEKREIVSETLRYLSEEVEQFTISFEEDSLFINAKI